MSEKRKLKIIKISMVFLEEMLKGKFDTAKAIGLPKEFEIVRVSDQTTFYNGVFEVVISSDEFEPIEYGLLIPELVVKYERY